MNEVGRNDPCPCGSGKKYKKCCGIKKSMQSRSFSKVDIENSKASIQRITGLISQTIRKTNPEAADMLDKGIKEQTDKLDEKIEEIAEETEEQATQEDQKNNEDSVSPK